MNWPTAPLGVINASRLVANEVIQASSRCDERSSVPCISSCSASLSSVRNRSRLPRNAPSDWSADVSKVVALSTDKACEPVNAYGASKLLSEKLFLAANNARGAHGPRFAVCRYGNVAGSTGSVIPTWRRLIQAGQAVSMTDPDATRFWMRFDEAIQLVLYTAETMQGGELSIPVLPAYRVGDLAKAMGVSSRVMGLGAGEKLHESMRPGETSEHARRMSIDELRKELEHVA